ncbi:hypothetical protein [Bacteroides sp.]|uniref:hypothetical protein n=1 Tax=Bacteroides sp. TaxID=29523 RepID=UPI002FC80C80
MKYIDKTGIPIPTVLTTEGVAETTKNEAAYIANPNCEFTFKSRIYGHKDVKDALKIIQKDTCCFCESKVTPVGYGDIEHFRPKGAFQRAKGESLHKPGYFWLAYDWSNLLFACQVCNSSYKKNLFPLVDETKRAHGHAFSISHEEPIIINPSMEEPSLHIDFYQEIPYGKTPRGKETIQLIGLDRDQGLNENRLEKLTIMKTIENIAILGGNQAAYQFFKNSLVDRINYGEYTLMLKSSFSTHLIKP